MKLKRKHEEERKSKAGKVRNKIKASIEEKETKDELTKHRMRDLDV